MNKTESGGYGPRHGLFYPVYGLLDSVVATQPVTRVVKNTDKNFRKDINLFPIVLHQSIVSLMVQIDCKNKSLHDLY